MTLLQAVDDDGDEEIHDDEGAEQHEAHEVEPMQRPEVHRLVHDVGPRLQGRDLEQREQRAA
jgi:hypothetical protein